MSSSMRWKYFRPNLKQIALVLNVAFWAYFWSYFVVSSMVKNVGFYTDHPADPYTFFGHGIGVGGNPFALSFMRIMVAIQLPSFAIATFFQNVFTGEPSSRLLVGVLGDFGYRIFPGFPNGSGGRLFLGISINGYRLLAVMLLSFVQWFLIAKFLSWLARKFTRTSPPRIER